MSFFFSQLLSKTFLLFTKSYHWALGIAYVLIPYGIDNVSYIRNMICQQSSYYYQSHFLLLIFAHCAWSFDKLNKPTY